MEPRKSFALLGRAAAYAAVLALCYIGAGKLGLALSFENDQVTAFWPPTGIAVAAFLLYGLRLWPGVFVGAVIVNLVDGSSVEVASAIAIGNTLAPLSAAVVLRRLGVRQSLTRLRDVVTFAIAGGFVPMTISATVGASVLYLSGDDGFVRNWRTWWVGDAMGVILVAPMILTVLSRFREPNRVGPSWKAALPLLSLFTVITYAAVRTDGSPIGYAVIPLALWIAVQLEQEGAAAAIFIMTVLDLWGLTTSPETGVSVEFQLLRLQGVNATVAVIVLAFAAVMSERRKARDALAAAADDLEDRVRMRTAALERSEERLAQAQRLAHIGSFEWDATTDTNEWSDELLRIYGLAPGDEPPGFDRYLSFIRRDVRAASRSSVQSAIAAGESMNHEYPVVLDDGTQKWVHAYIEVLKGDHGALLGLRGTCQDITERKAAEDALRASELRFRTLLDSAPDAVVVVDGRGHIVVTNAQTSILLGYAPDELVGSPVEVFLPAELHELHRAYRRSYAALPSSRPMGAGRDLEARRKDGSLVPVDISLAPVHTDGGTLVIALLRDASERRRAEDALRLALQREQEASEDLRKLDDAKTSFLSAVSHELRTPLTAILGFAELLQDEELRSSDEVAVDLVDRLKTSATRLAELLGDLLDLDRLKRGILEPQRRPTVLRDVIERAVDAVAPADHLVTADVDDGTAFVDPAQTERIIENLLTNAVKYTPAGSAIRVTAKTLGNGGVDISVTDNGPGVPEELLQTIFEPFTRGDVGSFTPGTGIGLALVDRFAQLHGGRAWATNGRDGGAEFHVHMPGPLSTTRAVS